MMTPHTPHIPRSVLHWTLWVIALERGIEPSGLPVSRVRWFTPGTELVLPYLLPVDDYRAGVRYAGRKPGFVRPEEAGCAWFRLVPPCVVYAWSIDLDQTYFSQAVIVARTRDVAVARLRIGGHEASPVMGAVTWVVHRSKVEQQRRGRSTSAPEGRDPNGLD